MQQEAVADCIGVLQAILKQGFSLTIGYIQGYAKANTTADGLQTLKWGTDYLLRTLAKQTKAGQRYPEYNIAYQVHMKTWLQAVVQHCLLWILCDVAAMARHVHELRLACVA